MSMSGIKMDAELNQFYQDMNIKKTHKFAGFKITDDKKRVVVDTDMLGEKAVTKTSEEDLVHFNQLKDMLTKENPRYILYDFGFQGNDGREVRKLVFMYWCSNDSPITKRMIYTATKDDVKKCLGGAKMEFQVNDMSDMDYEDMKREVLKTVR